MTTITLADIDFLGTGLQRCECVLTTRSGDIFMSDKRGGVSIIRSSGATELLLAKNPPENFLPNGIALLPDRSFLIANLGPSGGVFHLSTDGTLSPYILEFNGKPLPPTNFVSIDKAGRTWVTVSTKLVPREQSMHKGYGDGFILVSDEKGVRLVADGLGFTNEAVIDPTSKWLYVNETIARCTSRFLIQPDGSLGEREVYSQYGAGTWPDGLTFDSEGGLWIVSVVSNRVIRTRPDGHQEIILEDSDPEWLDVCEQAFQNNTFSRQLHFDSGGKRKLGNISSIGFGGSDLKTVYLGSLFNSQLAKFKSEISGALPVHWDF
ncbi:SMP-30/gluconolactonase/LRE family protein [Polynucleobacter sinensis]|uniref:SMP-30/gluconolactonase/LRE family protein n=1 Tax=Polynucleobacter sinensis TaxID=1743157 RepID=UPI000782BC5F|nr:SMP-30/gluconolactonase/LRE family protein [Polynucleobacter sinensis]